MEKKNKSESSIVISRVGSDNRVVFPKAVMDALALRFDDRLIIRIDAQEKRLAIKKLDDAVEM